MLAWCCSMCILMGDDVVKKMLSYIIGKHERISENLFPRKHESLPGTYYFLSPFCRFFCNSTSNPMMYMSYSSYDISLMLRTCEYKLLSMKKETYLFLQPQQRIFISLILNRLGSSWGRGIFSMDAGLLRYSYSSSSPFPSSEFGSDKTL